MENRRVLGRRRPALAGSLAALALLLSGCGEADYEPSPYDEADLISPEGVTLEVAGIWNPSGRRTCGGMFTLQNGGDQVVAYSDLNRLERKDEDDGSWYSVASYPERTVTETEYTLSPGETVTYETTWEQLEDGWYRYVMPVRLEGSDDGTGYVLWTDFLTWKS